MNIANREAFLASVETLGETYGDGLDAIVKLDVEVATAVRDGAIVPVLEKGKVDDIAVVWNAYIVGATRKRPETRSEDSNKKAISQLRAIGLAANVLDVDFADVLATVKSVRETALKTDVPVKTLHQCFVDVAVKQKAMTATVSRELIETVIRKPAAQEKTLVKMLQQHHKALSTLLSPKSNIQIDDDHRADLVDVLARLGKIYTPVVETVATDELAELRRAAAELAARKTAEAAQAAAAEEARLAAQAVADGMQNEAAQAA